MHIKKNNKKEVIESKLESNVNRRKAHTNKVWAFFKLLQFPVMSGSHAELSSVKNMHSKKCILRKLSKKEVCYYGKKFKNNEKKDHKGGIT